LIRSSGEIDKEEPARLRPADCLVVDINEWLSSPADKCGRSQKVDASLPFFQSRDRTIDFPILRT